MMNNKTAIIHRGTVLVLAIILAAAAGTDAAQAQMVNPYAGIDWENVRPLHSFSHQQGIVYYDETQGWGGVYSLRRLESAMPLPGVASPVGRH